MDVLILGGGALSGREWKAGFRQGGGKTSTFTIYFYDLRDSGAIESDDDLGTLDSKWRLQEDFRRAVVYEETTVLPRESGNNTEVDSHDNHGLIPLTAPEEKPPEEPNVKNVGVINFHCPECGVYLSDLYYGNFKLRGCPECFHSLVGALKEKGFKITYPEKYDPR